MIKKPAIPTMVTTEPMIAKMIVQLSDLERSKNIKPPNTARIATNGIMALMPSAALDNALVKN